MVHIQSEYSERISPKRLAPQRRLPRKDAGNPEAGQRLRLASASERPAPMVAPAEAAGPGSEPVELALSVLRTESLVRLRPTDPRHVAVLAEVSDRWPPILVARTTLTVLDGMHRVAAARRLGNTSILANLFDGDEEEAFVEAVRGNVEHGLPLSPSERAAAARRLLTSKPGRSDRAIGEICGLDHKTVARLREQVRRPTGEIPRLDVRIGRDHRARPVDAASLRVRIAAAISQTPGDSLRQIAKRVGGSPETVRDVRARLARGEDPVPTGARTGEERAMARAPATWPTWMADTACCSAPDAADFAAWFDQAGGITDWQKYVEAVPLSRIYEIADQARAYSEAWRGFAERLEGRSRSAAASQP
jgi:ParB-like chromosome segregation protein Spo0J